jgi:hypothetical protein|tara:strand:- start:160 stop:696 length:537 start_codon:yes stop_codon:yes gene_type:complete
MKMISIILVLWVYFFSPSMGEEKIEWTEGYKLQWTDFKAKTALGTGFVASTSSGIAYSYSFRDVNGKKNSKINVFCNFYPQKSWYVKNDASNYILKHEQTHFDISELYKRIFKKRIDATQFSDDMKKELEVLFYQTEDERVAMQRKFDSEADHSKNKKKELEWETYVAQQLVAYERWK